MSGNSSPPTLRTRLLIVLASSIVPAFLMMIALLTYDYEQDRKKLTVNTIATARALVSALDLQLGGIQASLTTLATSRMLRSGNLGEFYLQAQEVSRLQNIVNVVLLYPAGGQVFNTLLPFDASTPGGVSKPAVNKALQTGKLGVTDVFHGPVMNRALVAVVAPVVIGDKLVYSLSAGVDLNTLKEILIRQNLPPDWVAAITDSQGVIVARTRDHDKFVGTPVQPALFKRMSEVGEDTVESTTVDDVPVLTAFSHSSMSNWSVVIGIPQTSLTQDLKRDILWLVAGTLVLLAATSLLAWRVGGNILKSVSDLADAVGAMGRGHQPRIPDMSFREAQTLVQAFERSSSMTRAAQEEATDHEDRLRAILESAMDAIIVADEGQRIILFNAAAGRMFGYDSAQAIGSDLAMLLPERLRDPALVPAAAVVSAASQRGSSSVMTGLRRDGSEFAMNVSISKAIHGKHHFYTLVLRDITQELASRDALVRNNMDLQQFAFVASHDLRTPMRSVRGYLGLLRSRYGDGMAPKAVDLLHRADTALGQLDRLTEDLLHYARLGETAIARQPVDCNALVQETLSLLDAAIRQSEASIKVGPLPTLDADRMQLIQLFQNLIGNAVKYHGELAPRVHISATRGLNDWEFSIQDNGIGIEPQHQNRIFEIFKRLHTTQEYPGSGIGLAVCKRVVEQHGGRLWVTSGPERGSTFYFTIADIQGENHGPTS